MVASLLTTGNPKTLKSLKPERARVAGATYFTAVLHLAPARVSGRNLCADASLGCIALCLNTAGRGGIIKRGETTNAIQQARIRRSQALRADPGGFVKALVRDVGRHVRRAERLGHKACIRLNGTSDLPFENLAPELFAAYPDTQFYDYCKGAKRYARFLAGGMPENYHLTFSRSEDNERDVLRFLAAGGSVAVICDSIETARAAYPGVDVYSADLDDLRFLDMPGVQFLTPKGKARKDETGMVLWGG